MNEQRVSLKQASVVIVPLYAFFLLILGKALKTKTNMNVWQIALTLLFVTGVLVNLLYKFYKKSLLKTDEQIREENNAVLEVDNIVQGRRRNTALGRWYFAALTITVIFPYLDRYLYRLFGFEEGGYMILLIGYIIIFVFIFGIIFMSKNKNPKNRA
jgi:hypothetical protein